ncbi:MAG: tetratricopeptide repeat protein [Candidatus Omnitrophota bacterium]
MKDSILRSGLAVFAAAFVVLAAVYSPLLHSNVGLADSILSAPPVSYAGDIPLILSRDFTAYTDGQYRPLSYILLAAARTFISADNILFWRLWMLGFHALNAALVFSIVRLFSECALVSLFAAAAFALHPLCTAVVNDIDQFHILLGLTFTLLSMNSYFSFHRQGKRWQYAYSILFFLLSLFTARLSGGLGLFLLLYEILYERTSAKRALARAFVFLLLPFFFLPLWSAFRPNPNYYRYATTLSPDTFLYSFISVMGATGDYLGGLLFSWGYPSILYEKAAQIFSPAHSRFLFWALFDLAFLLSVFFAIIKKHWAAIGLLASFAAMLPYSSIALNPVLDYVAWPYLYFPMFGAAFFMGGMLESCRRMTNPYYKIAGQIFLAAILIFWGVLAMRINYQSRSPVSYWSCALKQNPASPSAALKLGEAYLREGDESNALRVFFSPGVREINEPCLMMARHYLQEGDAFAASIHLRYGMQDNAPGLIYEKYCRVSGELMLAIDALDHAEDNFGKIVMVNPFDADAMIHLARIWHRKGRAAAARRMVEQVRSLAPSDPAISMAENDFAEEEKQWEDNPQLIAVTPPDPEWLQYLLNQELTPGIMQKIIELSSKADENDAVIHMEAIIAFLESGHPQEAAAKAINVMRRLSGNAYACSISCRALAMAGKSDLAVKAGLQAIAIDINNKMAWESLAVAYALQDKPGEMAEKFLEALSRRPEIAFVFYYNLGLEKRRKNLDPEAVELFKKSLQAKPNQYDAQLALGEALFDLGQTDASIDAFRKAIALKPGMDAPHGKLGGALLSQDKISEAQAELRAAIQLEPNIALYHNNLGVCLAKQILEEEAMKEYRRAIELDPHLDKAHFNLANSLLRENRIDEAIAEFRKTLEAAPDHPYAHFNLGHILYRKGEIEDSIHELREQIQRHPQFAEAYSFLIAIYFNRREYGLAWDAAKQANNAGVPLDPKILDALKKVSPPEDRNADDFFR